MFWFGKKSNIDEMTKIMAEFYNTGTVSDNRIKCFSEEA